MDTKVRSIVKSIVWRITGIILLSIITYAITKDMKAMGIITILFHGIMIIMYYFHERIWEKISWGKIKHPLANIPVKKHLTPEDDDLIKEKLKQLGYID